MNKRGFSMVELAIVLAILGALIGSVYVAAGSMYASHRQKKAERQIMMLVKNMRSNYSNTALNGTPTVAYMQSARIIPPDMEVRIRAGRPVIYNAYGPVVVEDNTAGLQKYAFNISMIRVPENDCIFFVNRFATPVLRNQAGMCGFTIGGVAAISSANATLSEANTNCDTSNVLDMCFNLKTQ